MGFSLDKAVSSIFGGGDSGSSSSSSTATNYNDSSTKTENVTDFGVLSHDNLSLSGNAVYNEQGITGQNLDNLLGAVNTLSNNTQSTLANTFAQMTSSVQNSAERAISTTAQAYAESDNELRSAIDGLRPIILYVALAALGYFIFKGSK